MTGMQTAILTYVLSFLLLAGYAFRVWRGLRSAAGDLPPTPKDDR